MNDEVKEAMIIAFIRDYKNKDFTDDEIREKYPLAIEYMKEHFSDIEKQSANGNVKSIKQGSRSIEYSNSKDFISNNGILIRLLGKPFARLY